MVVKVYVSVSSGNFEVKKHQQRIETVLESVGVRHDLVDVSAPEHQEDRLFMQKTARTEPGELHPLPPQIYNERHYCGDYGDFDYANETGQLLQFLRLQDGDVSLPGRDPPPEPTPAPEPPIAAQQNRTARLAGEPPAPERETEEPPGPPPAPVVPPPSPSPEPEQTELTRKPRDEPWEIDRSGGDCLDVDKEA